MRDVSVRVQRGMQLAMRWLVHKLVACAHEATFSTTPENVRNGERENSEVRYFPVFFANFEFYFQHLAQDVVKVAIHVRCFSATSYGGSFKSRHQWR